MHRGTVSSTSSTFVLPNRYIQICIFCCKLGWGGSQPDRERIDIIDKSFPQIGDGQFEAEDIAISSPLAQGREKVRRRGNVENVGNNVGDVGGGSVG
jgi:hypothetical protein